MATYTKQTKHTASWLKQIKKGHGYTWADMDMTWEELEKMGDPTWENLEAITWAKQSKNTASFTNQAKL